MSTEEHLQPKPFDGLHISELDLGEGYICLGKLQIPSQIALPVLALGTQAIVVIVGLQALRVMEEPWQAAAAVTMTLVCVAPFMLWILSGVMRTKEADYEATHTGDAGRGP